MISLFLTKTTTIFIFVLCYQTQSSQAVFLKSIFDNWYLRNSSNLCTGPDPKGTCQLSMTCWMQGGTPQGTCGGYVYICCVPDPDRSRGGHTVETYAQPRKLDFWDSLETNDVEVLHDISFGPVKNEKECGLQTVGRRRIVGGYNAGFGVYPWQALILNQQSRCGGALIDKWHVVTAGHCVSNFTNSYKKPVGMRVLLGEYSLNKTDEPYPTQRRLVSKVYVHPYYRFSPQADRYDVAVLKLDRPVQYRPHILPICLPAKNQYIPELTHAMVSGWGARDPESNLRPRYLQAVDVRVVDSKRCEDWHSSKRIRVRYL